MEYIKTSYYILKYHIFKKIIHLDLIYIEPEFRNKGEGSKLLQSLLDKYPKHEFYIVVSSQHGMDFERLKKWYERFGFISTNISCMRLYRK